MSESPQICGLFHMVWPNMYHVIADQKLVPSDLSLHHLWLDLQDMLMCHCMGHLGKRFVYLGRAFCNPESLDSQTGIWAHRSCVQCQSPPSGTKCDRCLCFPAPRFRCQPTDRTSGPAYCLWEVSKPILVPLYFKKAKNWRERIH